MHNHKKIRVHNPLIRTNGKIKITACTLFHLAMLYNIHRHTFRKMLEPFKNEIGLRQGYTYSVIQVKIIFQKLGEPSDYDFEEE